MSLGEVTRLLGERRRTGSERPIVAGSARNRFPGIVTRIEKDRIAAVVEILAGPHRIVSLMTAEAVDEMGLKVGDEAVGVVKATNVIVEIPSSKEPVEGVEAPRRRHPRLHRRRRVLGSRRVSPCADRGSDRPARAVGRLPRAGRRGAT